MELPKSALTTAMTLALGGASFSARAALTTSTVLSFDTGVISNGVAVSGSWFANLAADTDFDYEPDTNVYTALSQSNGIHIGTVQSASGSHGGSPGCDPSASSCTGAGGPGENPDIDVPWAFFPGSFSSTGMHLTTSPITEVGTTSGGAHLLDFSGWDVDWNGAGNGFQLGDPANFPSDTELATIVCSTTDCAIGSTFTLDYSAHHTLATHSNTGGILYTLHLEGVVTSAVPVPAALWLFGSGLVGLTVLGRRKRDVPSS